MSHYSTISLRVKREHIDCIIEALVEMGFDRQHIVNVPEQFPQYAENGMVLRAWNAKITLEEAQTSRASGARNIGGATLCFNDPNALRAHVVIKKESGGLVNDTGILLNKDGSATFYIDPTGRENFTDVTSWSNRLKAICGQKITEKRVKQKGFQIIKKERQGTKVRMFVKIGGR